MTTAMSTRRIVSPISGAGCRRPWRQLPTPTDRRSARRWARYVLTPGTAVILDTETTDLDGEIVEICVIDACTEQVLLSTLVNPRGPISPAASAVHGITAADVVDAPSWSQVLPLLIEAVGNRQILAYSAHFDRERVLAASYSIGAAPTPLNRYERWECVMRARSAWLGIDRWLPLGGPHRALGDVALTRDLLIKMSHYAPRRWMRTLRGRIHLSTPRPTPTRRTLT